MVTPRQNPWQALQALLGARANTPTLPIDQTAQDSAWQGDVPNIPPATDVRPRVNQPPIGRSGRAHFGGFIELDERNPELQGDRGLRKFDAMYRQDAHVRRLVLMVGSPIQSGTWQLEPHGGDDASDQDKDIADAIWWALTEHMSPNFYEHLGTLLPVLIRSGFAPFEQIWNTTTYKGKQLTLPAKLDLRLPRTIWKWFQDENGDLAAISQILPNAANVTIPASEVVYYRLQSEGDNWMGTSLLRQCYRSWYFKWHLEEIEAIGLERKAMGVPFAYPPNGADDQTKSELETVLANLHVNEVGYVVMPGPHQQYDKDNGWVVDVIKFDSSSGGEINDAINRHADAMAASFLGDFMQLGHHQVGARATAEVQEDPFLTAEEGLKPFIVQPLQGLVDRMCAVNWPSADGSPRLKCTLTDSASLSEIGVYVQQLVASGAMQADPQLEDWLRERADMPAADGEIRKARLAAKMEALQNPPQPPMPGVSGQSPSPQNGKPQPQQQTSQQAAQQKAAAATSKQLDAADGDPDIVDSAWFERLLHKDRLAEGLSTARQRVSDLARSAVQRHAQQAATAAAAGQDTPAPDPGMLTALADAFHQLYALGKDTVLGELHDQHQTLNTGRTAAEAGTARRGSVASRAQLSATAIANDTTLALRQALAGGKRQPPLLHTIAERAALNRLTVEANANSMPLINAGRFDAADANRADVVQAQQTACLDDRTCDECAAENGTIYDTVTDAEAAVPVGLCAGGPSRCRCTVVFMLSSDPRAFGLGG